MEVALVFDDSLWAPPLIILFLAALFSSSAWVGLANGGSILLALILIHGAPVAGASWRHLNLSRTLRPVDNCSPTSTVAATPMTGLGSL